MDNTALIGIVSFLGTTAIGIIGFFLKDIFGENKELKKEVQDLKNYMTKTHERQVIGLKDVDLLKIARIEDTKQISKIEGGLISIENIFKKP